MIKYKIAGVLIWAHLAFQAQTFINPSLNSKTSFAIIVDSKTYQEAKQELTAYQKSVEKDGLGTYIIHHQWKNPDEIRTVLKKLYDNDKQPLEGAVFVGDIPIPMIRGAQYLTSSFKMSEALKWDRSSVASDRFYDDFDLKFDFLKQEENLEKSNYFYYQIRPESPQYIEMDIYSARIKPPISQTENSTEEIKKYLRKIIKIREENNPLNQMIVSTGHGYNSNSTLSWGEEMVALKSSFPKLFHQGNSIKFLNFRNTDFLKNLLLAELKKEESDFAFMTGHGTVDTQLLNGYPNVSAPQPSMDNVARYIRSKMRSAKEDKRDLEKVKTDFQKNLGLNDKWFNEAFSPDMIEQDSVYNHNLDLHIEDVKNINTRVVYLNSCLTGSFHEKDYLAGHYPFSEGKNVVAFANSVGVLQDLWGTQLIGILQQGIRAGHLLKKTAFLETHLLGDPTFHFSGENQNRYNELFGRKATHKKEWYKILKIEDADLQAYALTELYRLVDEKEMSEILYKYFIDSPYESVRTQAYFLLRKYQNETFNKVLKLAMSDNYEYIKRKSIYDVTEVGSNDFIEPVVKVDLYDQEAERVQYKINWIFQFLDQDLVKKELDKQLKNNPLINNSAELYKAAADKLDYEKKKTQTSKEILLNPSSTEKQLLSELRTMRGYRNHQLVPAVISLIKNEKNSSEIRITALEALSWYGMSYEKENILKTCQDILNSGSDDNIKNQALKTINVIKDVGKRQF